MASRRSINSILKKTSWKVGEHDYRVAWCDRIDGKDTLGYCDDDAKVIYLKDDQTAEDAFSTLIHEIIHAMEFEHKIDISHKAVHKLERAIMDFITQNKVI